VRENAINKVENVAAGTQNQAPNALVFLCREVLGLDLGGTRASKLQIPSTNIQASRETPSVQVQKGQGGRGYKPRPVRVSSRRLLQIIEALRYGQVPVVPVARARDPESRLEIQAGAESLAFNGRRLCLKAQPQHSPRQKASEYSGTFRHSNTLRLVYDTAAVHWGGQIKSESPDVVSYK